MASQQHTSSLLGLHADCMGLVTRLLPGIALHKLVMCGNRELSSLLARPGAVTSYLLNTHDWSGSTWPSLHRMFSHLIEFQITSYIFTPLLNVDELVSTLPHSLKRLSISKGSYSRLTISSSIELASLLPNLTDLKLENREPIDPVFPPSLTRLDLYLWDFARPLPISLVSLAVHITAKPAEGEETVLHQIHEGLESLSINICKQTAILWFLPQSLTSLRMPGESLNDDQTAALPRSLKSAHFGTVRLQRRNLSSFPPNLTSLTADAMSKDDCSAIPQSLTKLAVSYVNYGELLSWQDLPASLTHFEAVEMDGSKLSFVSPIPALFSNLRTIRLCNFRITPWQMSLLPRMMTSMWVRYLDRRHFAAMPQSITDLDAPEMHLCPDAVRLMPRTIKRLQCRMCPEDHVMPEYDSTQLVVPGPENAITVVKEGLEIHRNSLARLCAELSASESDGSCTFPPNATNIYLGHVAECLTDAFALALPHKATVKLELVGPVESPEFRLPFTDRAFTRLGSTLTEVRLAHMPHITSALFQQLPRTLLELSMDTAQIFDEHIAHLPRRLHTAHLPQARKLTTASLPHWPPHLTRLNLDLNDLIKEEDFPLVPQSLRQPEVPESFLTADFFVSYGEAYSMNNEFYDQFDDEVENDEEQEQEEGDGGTAEATNPWD